MERPITVESIKKMSEEEVQDLYRKLAIQVFLKFLTLMVFKWVLIFEITRILRKYIESNQKEQ